MIYTWNPVVNTPITELGGYYLDMEMWYVVIQNLKKGGIPKLDGHYCWMRLAFLCFEYFQPEEPEEDFGTGYLAKTQKHLWNLFENPHHSCAAKVIQAK